MPNERRRPSQRKLRSALTAAKRMLRSLEGVHSVDYGYAYSGGVRTDRASIRFHVRHKRPPAALDADSLLPAAIDGVPVDVLEAGYRSHAAGNPRDEQSPLRPGISIGNIVTSETGTLGALVRGPDGAVFLLSNWHVLAAGPGAAIGDQIVQPGPMHAGASLARPVATLERFLAPGGQLDAALARLIDGTAIDPELFGLTVVAGSAAEPALGAKLVKSGAASGVTEAMVDGIHGSYSLDYSGFGLDTVWMRGFRLVKDPDGPAAAISEPGDSGSLWVDPDRGAAVGLHFAGEDDASPLNDYALAHAMPEILQRLNVALIT